MNDSPLSGTDFTPPASPPEALPVGAPAAREVVDVDLNFLRKVRGLQAVSRYSARDDGSCLVTLADGIESRVFHVARVRGDMAPLPLAAYSVETLRKVEISEGRHDDAVVTPRYVGVSDDALYGFLGSRKSRFLSDRRATFADVSLGETGERFAVLFSDLLASGWAVALGALGENGGRLLWTKDIGFTASRVAINRGGDWVAVAGSGGDVQVFGSGRELAMKSAQNVRITGLATLGPQFTLYAGAVIGEASDAAPACVVGVLGADGGRQWLTRLTGTLVEVGCDGTGQVVACLVRSDDGQGRLVLLGAQGLPSAEIELGGTPTGLSVAPSGGCVAVSLRDGTLAMYAPRFGPRMAEAGGADVVARSRELATAKRFEEASAALQARLQASPADTDACDALISVLTLWRAETVNQARQLEDQEHWEEADAVLHRFLHGKGGMPHDPELLRERLALRGRWVNTTLTQGRDALIAGDTEEAERYLRSAIAADPLHRDARAALSSAQTATRLRLERDGQARLKSGDFAQAVSLLRQARQSGTNRPEIAQMLREAQIGEALTEGNRLYQERQYDAATFHFKKVLRLRPDHAEARLRLGYAESMSQASPVSDRFRRLE